MKQKEKAFTLIELLVVIVIIGILATVSIATWAGNIDKAKEGKQLAEDTQEYQRLLAECVLAGRTDCSDITVGGFLGPSGVCGKRSNSSNGIIYNAAGEVLETGKLTSELVNHCTNACTVNQFYTRALNAATTPYYGHVWTGVNMTMYICYPLKIQSGHICGETTTSTMAYFYDAGISAYALHEGNSIPIGFSAGTSNSGSSQVAAENHCSNECILGNFTVLQGSTVHRKYFMCN